jgi:hypothetical protein
MIAINDLKINNYVYYNNEHNEIGIITKLITDIITDINYVGINNRIDVHYLNKHINPIPITKEWLLNFGFKKIESDFKIQIQKDNKDGNTDYWIYVDSGIDNETNKFTIEILCQEGCWFTSKNQYVHQLQNLYFALTGKELTLNNK